MPLAVSLSAADLSALLCSRICHDLISPVGAINNALELYDEGEAEEDALHLTRLSATSASARLQFARIAYGAAGSEKAQIDTGEAEIIAQKYMANEKADLVWNGPRLLLPKNEIKLLLNLIALANTCLPRGGIIHLTLHHDQQRSQFRLVCTGKLLHVPPKFMELHKGTAPAEPIDAHSVQFYYTLLLADLTNMPVTINMTGKDIVFSAG